MTSRVPAAVLWDMDGTLVDTEPLWFAAEHALITAHGGTWTEADAVALIGSDLLAAGAYLREHGNVALTPEQIVDHLLGEVLRGVRRHVEWRAGARELIVALRALGVPCGLVTMSYRNLAEAVAGALPAGTFDVIVTGDEVQHGKPHPEPYLTAAKALGVDIADCVVIEDSATGAASGRAAGAYVLGVPNIVALEPAPGMVVLDTLAGLAPTDLLAAFDDARLDPV